MSAKKPFHRKHALFLTILLLMQALLGCGPAAKETAPKPQPEQTVLLGMETEPVLAYEVPAVLPGILVNRIGYEASSYKTAVVQGNRQPSQFRIINAETGEVVYTGTLEQQGYDNQTKEYNSYGDFSALTEEGVYYVECDILGRSYPFAIRDTMYEDLMEEAAAFLDGRRDRLTETDILDVCQCVSTLLLSYELFGSVYEGQTEAGKVPPMIALVKAYAEWLLACQDTETGALMSEEGVRWEETAWMTAVLAKFSYTYQKYDSVYATVCLQASDKAWKYLTEKGELGTGEKEEEAYTKIRFYAAAELYRATGRNEYHSAVLKLSKDIMPDVDDRALVFGTLTYASTKRSVSLDLCTRLTKALLDEAERIAERAQEDVFSTGSSISEESLEQILWDIVVMSSVDYIITNHEYATLIENHLHYLAGTNETAACYICHEGEEADREKSCMSAAVYVMMLSEILSHEQEGT